VDTAKFVEFGRGGDTVHFARGHYAAGYGTPENPHAAQIKEGRAIPDGTLALDQRQAIGTKAGYAWVFRGPLLNVDLPVGEVLPLHDPGRPASIIEDVLLSERDHNDYGRLVALHRAHEETSKDPGPLDEVDIQTYIAGWLRVGARLGRYEGGRIVWDDEEI
jgi:hypothetical protein